MALVVGYDRHPARRTAVLFAGEFASALNVPAYAVDVVDRSDSPISATPARLPDATERMLDAEHQDVGNGLEAAHVQWTHPLLNGDPVNALPKAADEYAASMLVVGRPEHGLEAALGHIVTGTVARSLLRRSRCRVVAVLKWWTTDE